MAFEFELESALTPASLPMNQRLRTGRSAGMMHAGILAADCDVDLHPHQRACRGGCPTVQAPPR
ncbi:hypothetical protein A7D17_15050 [Xanthomonas floridensis]|uniref:Uncharacterized protein n=1 Tax=Xanthomonas floridensis TaxID=1843580 RepID=A0A1A9MDA4_9XANT|nr:hypothetical protein A7D17_15050 [Xanthomonas floridensis]